jgi:hypothetical protein
MVDTWHALTCSFFHQTMCLLTRGAGAGCVAGFGCSGVGHAWGRPGIALVGSFFCWAAGLLCYFSGKGPDFKVWVVVSIFYILAGHGYEGGHRACCDV